MNCCEPDYETVFSEKRAKQDLKRYRRKGADGTTRHLIDALKAAGVQHLTLLDIGGGIGVIDQELLAAGLEAAIHVEASEPFARVAEEEAVRRGTRSRMEFRRGDFVAMADDVPAADVVTLDRVICCYAQMESLVLASAARARRFYGVVIPRQRTLTKTMRLGINTMFRITRNPFRFYLHPPAEIDRVLRRAGLRLHSIRDTLIWRVAVYERPRERDARKQTDTTR